MLASERRVPMFIAAIALAAASAATAARATPGAVPPAATLAIGAVTAAAIFGAHMRRRSAAAAAYGRVVVGTLNACKLRAVERALMAYPEVADVDSVQGCDVATGVSEQPIGLEVTATGARNRAVAAYERARQLDATCGGEPSLSPLLGLGIESGLVELLGCEHVSSHSQHPLSWSVCQRPLLVCRLGVFDGVPYAACCVRAARVPSARARRHLDVCVVDAYDGREHHLGLSCAFEIPPPILGHVLQRGLDLSQACNAARITTDPKLGAHGGLIGLLSSNRLTREDYTVQAVSTALFHAADAAQPWYASAAAPPRAAEPSRPTSRRRRRAVDDVGPTVERVGRGARALTSPPRQATGRARGAA